MTDTIKRPPALGARGNALWASVTAEYDMRRPDELELLTEACRLVTLCEDLAGDVRAAGFVSTGSQGQVVVHPLLGALQTARGELRNVFRQLRLPDTETGEDDVTRDARAAAARRWHNVRGGG